MALITTEVNVSNVIAKAALMMRVKLNQATVNKYAKEMDEGAVFPPIICYDVEDELVLVDGFHRLHAYKKCGVETIHADVRLGTMDEALLAAVRANANEGLERTNADKEKSVRALLASERWRGMSDREIARETAVFHTTVGKFRKTIKPTGDVTSSNAPNRETRLGKDGKRRPATRGRPTAAPAAVRAVHKPPPLPKLTREQIGAPAPGTENDQDPDSPSGVTRAQAWSAKHGHVHLRPLDEKKRAESEKIATSFITDLRELAKIAEKMLKHSPDDLVATIYAMNGNAMAKKFEERMSAIEPLLTRLNAINAMRAKKSAA